MSDNEQLILLADDSITTLTMVSARLQRAGYEIITVTRGDDALALILDRRPALVILDLDMPGLDGLEVTRRLRENPSLGELPIILLTSHNEPAKMQEALEAGANAYVEKPFSPQDLALRVTQLLSPG